MKRSTEVGELESITTMANCLMLLSKSRVSDPSPISGQSSPRRVFECKTCNRQFPSFQALGGHRASHKKPRLGVGAGDETLTQLELSPPSIMKPKTHECSICGIEFAIGQALGGHMRRHRATMHDQNQQQPSIVERDVLKKSSGKRVLCLDLNLTPLENDLEFRLGGKVVVAPMVTFFPL
ncbi:hypothetical protein RJ641_005512 [Dillenia turbinata]|uniref:C2H2-type domain-containing protein n=1 Tax=Dillenia turbinata TaxID=194707 RepID=A0AAN8VKZ3_9MAGN